MPQPDRHPREAPERAPLESEDTFRSISEESPNMIFINVAGRVVYANRQCETMTGYSRDEFCDDNFDFMSLIAPEYHAQTLEAFKSHMSDREVPPYEYAIVRKDGRRLDTVITTRLITYEGHRAILGIITDITRVKATEGKLVEAANQLERQAEELQSKNAALKEVLARIEDEKLAIRRQVQRRIWDGVLPVLDRLKTGREQDRLRAVQEIETTLAELVSEYGLQTGSVSRLNPRETEICGLIRSGLDTRQIADSLGISVRTVETHRTRIRRKLGIANRSVNLATYLRSLP